MFDGQSKKKGTIWGAEAASTVIGQGSIIEGSQFKGTGTVRIDGIYYGDMVVDGHIVIGQTGEIKGNLTAISVLIAGTVFGNIICSQEAHFTETASAIGEVITPSIIVDQGASLNGAMTTAKPEEKEKSEKPEPFVIIEEKSRKKNEEKAS